MMAYRLYRMTTVLARRRWLTQHALRFKPGILGNTTGIGGKREHAALDIDVSLLYYPLMVSRTLFAVANIVSTDATQEQPSAPQP
jgi:hypothetical protein